VRTGAGLCVFKEKSMNELIKVENKQIGSEKVNAVDARGLHEFLEVKSDFRNWIKNRVKDYDFKENQDFVSFGKILPAGGKTKEYVISLDMAKELSMVERNAKGKQARQYFITCEKKLKGEGLKVIKKTPSMAKLASDLEASVKIAKIFGLEGNQALLSANRMTNKYYPDHNIDLLKASGVKLITEKQVQYFTPTELGKQIGNLSAVKVNKLLEQNGYQIETRGSKNRLIWKVTPIGKTLCQILDTGKTHSDGTPVQQCKWRIDAI